ncbi:sulfite exporter TauE/SafE family protein [Virgibacillus siamensis]|uniref:Probable membrane transporter protein n=1 Tax=Virgibacillus siamensis TaxID=480071 RepID=A0ABP3R2W6_9BACI
MEYGLMVIIIIFLIGFVGSFASGMAGIGGAIINFPMLLYIPAALGVTDFSSYEVSGITAVQVLFATIGGVWGYRKGGYLNKIVIAYMGISILIGSFAGGYISSHMTEGGVNFVYGVLALLAAFMMFVPNKGLNETAFNTENFNRWIAAALALFVGVGAGIVGAGGAFILVPIMLVILKVPTRMTIASSLAITFLSSIGSTAGKVLTGHVLFVPAVIVIIASLIASPLGAKVGRRISTKLLQRILAILILATAIKIWLDFLN